MVILLDHPLSPYAQKVKMALLEKQIAFETRLPNLDAPEPALRALSPRVEVPALLDGEIGVFDSSIIVEYIEDRWPTPPLLPTGASERARVRMLEEICDTAYDAVNWGIAEVTVFRRAEGEAAAYLLGRAREQVAALNARLERELHGRAWFNGERFGFGDIVVYPFVNGAASLGNKPAAGGRLEQWLKSVRQRPSADRLKQDILGSLAKFMMNRPKQIAEGKARRQYRDHRLDWMMRSGGLQIVLDGIKANSIRFSFEFE
jgi:glutathione S-transferase